MSDGLETRAEYDVNLRKKEHHRIRVFVAKNRAPGYTLFRSVVPLEKSLYFVVNWSDAKNFTDALRALDIPFVIETPSEIPSLQPGQLAFVFPSLPVRIYAKIRTLFGAAGEPY